MRKFVFDGNVLRKAVALSVAAATVVTTGCNVNVNLSGFTAGNDSSTTNTSEIERDNLNLEDNTGTDNAGTGNTVTENTVATEPREVNSAYAYRGSEVFKAYADYLRNNALGEGDTPGDLKADGHFNDYTLEFIDEDNIPELVFGGYPGIHASNIYILSYKNGKVVQYGPFGAYNSTTFIPRKNLISTSNMGMGTDGTYYSCLNDDGTYTTLFHDVAYLDENDDKEVEHHYYIGEEEVSEEEYEENKDKYEGDGDYKVWYGYENSYGYIGLVNENVNALEKKEAFYDADFEVTEENHYYDKKSEIFHSGAMTHVTEIPADLDKDSFVAYESLFGVPDVETHEYIVSLKDGEFEAYGLYTDGGNQVAKEGEIEDEEGFLALLSSLTYLDVEFDYSGLEGSGWFGDYGVLYFMQDGELCYCYTYNIF